ncbi:hypothetical protein J6590_082058, partial [Homalodisca vitripennis]
MDVTDLISLLTQLTVTSKPPSIDGQADCLQRQDHSVVSHLSSTCSVENIQAYVTRFLRGVLLITIPGSFPGVAEPSMPGMKLTMQEKRNKTVRISMPQCFKDSNSETP